MNAPIVAAMAQRRLLKLAYSAGNRIIGMHVSGRKDDGLKLLHCYPIADESVSYERPGWKLLWVDGIAIIEVFNVRFEQRTK